ncbi:MAG TPA: DUF1802 family protein [Chthoniobacterales bacterium]|nr:DUF1802 family protein [Chthoniobacterales bacterium]
MESAGFKEWAIVCAALGSGQQSIILRKGGIAEGRDGFCFQHREFFLFPTAFHEQWEKTRLPRVALSRMIDGEVEINFWVKIHAIEVVTSLEKAEALAPLHVLRPSVVEERFNYKETRALHVAFVRVFRIFPAWKFPDALAFGGCRSWVKLPAPPSTLGSEPVIDDEEHAQRARFFRAIVGDAAMQVPLPS